jgi:hypothetical protein
MMDSRLREAITTAGLIYFGFCLGEKVNRVRRPFVDRVDTITEKIEDSKNSLEKITNPKDK